MSQTTLGKSLELYFVDGNPEGMLTAEMFNWTGHILMAPRTQLRGALARPEASHTGVSILLGEQDGVPHAYVGEAENLGYRIRAHDSQKEWWMTAVLITTKADDLHKAHVKYLEARQVEEANAIGNVVLENGNSPGRPGLSESAIANMEAFLENLLMMLPAIRVDMFVDRTGRQVVINTSTAEEPSPVFELVTQKHGIHATALLENGEFVVQKGSIARSEWAGINSSDTSYGQLYGDLVRSGLLMPDGDHRVFAENYAFNSPCAAAASTVVSSLECICDSRTGLQGSHT